ncbi:MAG: hypothetical protein ABIF10_08120 [Candidatus Woesearchaeota archaeon]
MLHKYHKLTVILLIALSVLFGLIFVAAYLGLRNGHALFATGLPTTVENLTVMGLSLAALVRVFFAILTIEHRKDL